jgi:prevent-host-death family protein
MIRVNMHEAKTQLSKLVEAVSNGEEVVICRDGVPAAALTPPPPERPPRSPGAWKGKFGPIPDEFYDPWSSKDFGPGVMDDEPDGGSSPDIWDGKTPRRPGSMKGVITLDATFFDPLTDEELGLGSDDPSAG